MRFDEILSDDNMLDALWDMRFDECTPIQEQAIPVILEGRDLIAVAQTGTGKTAAYLLPVLERLVSGEYPDDAVNCIVMAPTRELAQQIDRQMQGFAYFMGLSSVPIYGGTDGHTFNQQKQGLTMGADVVIATPGRLIAHLSMGYVDLSKVSFFILDEADRMLDMGFYEDIMQIVSFLPKKRQTLLFSATMPPKIQTLASKILVDPVEVKLAVSKPADKIEQTVYWVYEPQKLPLLRYIFRQTPPKRVIVFASSKLKVKELFKTLRGDNIAVGEMHSDLDQEKREQVILDFKAGKINVLVATDIVSRGIDIDDIEMVVNFDVPAEPEDYVHRIGRTARADADGKGVTFVSDRENSRFRRIESLLGKEIPKGSVPESLGETPHFSDGNRFGKQRKKGRVRGADNRKPHNNVLRKRISQNVASSSKDTDMLSESLKRGDGNEEKKENSIGVLRKNRRRRSSSSRKIGSSAPESPVVNESLSPIKDSAKERKPRRRQRHQKSKNPGKNISKDSVE